MAQTTAISDPSPSAAIAEGSAATNVAATDQDLEGGAVVRPAGAQAEKSATTRGRILEASVGCLIDLGYSGFTTVEVAARAGVSRGAMLHHYPAKADILSATMEFLHLKRLASLREGVERFSEEVDVVDAAVSLFWAMVRDPHFAAMQELKVAARTDPELRAKLSPISARFERELRRAGSELFAGYVREGAPLEEMEEVAAHMFEGLGMARNLEEDDAFAESTLKFFKKLIRGLLIKADDMIGQSEKSD